jgi:dTDP-4-dehydrorhamnose reductase
MIVLLGASGYVGSAMARELQRRGLEWRAVSRSDADYTRFRPLRDCLQGLKASAVVNCAGYTGKPNVDACELDRAGTLLGNVLLPQNVAQVCEVVGIPWGHVSSGCIYSGGKVQDPSGEWRVEPDLRRPDLWARVQAGPAGLAGFTEQDEPNFSFRRPPCSFYSGTKALAEEVLSQYEQGYQWRLRIPFDEQDGPRNYLGKLLRYPRVYENVNSISHRTEFVGACLDCFRLGVPKGIYNVVNPGWVTTGWVVERMRSLLRLDRKFEYWEDDSAFYQQAARTPRSNCLMDASRLMSVGIRLRPVEEALEDALRHWRPQDPFPDPARP